MITRIKICGVKTVTEAVQAAQCGADAVGLNFYTQSVRYLDPRLAGDIIRHLPPFTATVGVFVNEPIRRATAIAFQLGLRAIQTIDDRPNTEVTFPFAWVPAFRVKDASTLDQIRVVVSGPVRPAAVLLDSFVAGEMGGTGAKAPWEILAGFDPGVPVILAGGLTPDNVAEAIRIVQPWGVDVASGVESAPGVKDPARVRAFVDAVRSIH